MPHYILPVPEFLRGKLLNYNRLYSYPNVAEAPAKNGFIILDSGAFALSRSKKKAKMGLDYMKALNSFYKAQISKYPDALVYCAAPDVYLHPDASIAQFETWHLHCDTPVVPVLQSKRKGTWDWNALKAQARFYRQFQPTAIFVSNPGCRAAAVPVDEMQAIATLIRSETGATHLHNFGAGWDAADIQGWAAMNVFDSIDSVAYYTAKTRFSDGSFDRDPTARAIANAEHANLLMGNL